MSGFGIQVGGTTITATGTVNALKVYNVLVDVARVTKTATATGNTESEVVLHANMLAAIKWKSGGERILFNKETHYLDAIMKCRYCDITTDDHVVYAGKTYKIVDLYDLNNLHKLLVIALRKIG